MTGSDSSSSPLIVTNAEAAAFLGDPARRRYFLPFLGQASSVSEAAAQLGVKTNAMLYRVQQMARLGLLLEVILEPRAGRAIRHYRSRSNRCFIPFAATPFETYKAQVTHNEFAHHTAFAAALSTARHAQMADGGWGTLLEGDPLGNVTVSPAVINVTGVALPRDLPFLSRWSELRLSARRAQALEVKLRGLLEEFAAETHEPGGRRYLLHLGFVCSDHANESERG